MDEPTAKQIIVTALSDGDAVADLFVSPTAEQGEALATLERCPDAVSEDVAELVWEAVGVEPDGGTTWGHVAVLLTAHLGQAQAQIRQGAGMIAAARGAPRRMDRALAHQVAVQVLLSHRVSDAKAERLAHRAVRMWERGKKSEVSFSAYNHSLVVDAAWAIEEHQRDLEG